MTLRFTQEHLRRFSAASWDNNPLHLSPDYARTSAYGEPVVFGMLGCLAALAYTVPPEGQSPASVIIDFKAALLLNVHYKVAAQTDCSGGLKLSLLDGTALTVVMRLQFRNAAAQMSVLPDAGCASRAEARGLRISDLLPELSFTGEYSPGRYAFQELLQFCKVDRHAWGDAFLLTLLATSYLTGMELPGESAAFVGLRAEFAPVEPQLPSRFEVTLDSYDERFSLVESRFSLAGNKGAYARGEVNAIARPARARTDLANVAAGSGKFAGKTAVIIGASRGLGAALSLQLVAEGCTVVGVYARSRDAADEIEVESRGLPGRLRMEQGNPSDVHWCAALMDEIKAEFGSLDLLICNAAPPLQSLRFQAESYERMAAYLHRGFALVAAPLAAALDLISASEGSVLLVSSSAVEEPPPVWPHYVALKLAAEGLVRSALASHPKIRFSVARPGKLRTDLTNTPNGWLDAEDPQAVARRLVEAIAKHTMPGTVHSCR